MAKIIECVPNISEGCNKKVIDEIAYTVTGLPNVKLADYSSDIDHNRSVFTMFGTPDALEDAIIRFTKKVIELIDLTKHKGVHPRMGAVDVIPFIPIKEATMNDAILLSKRVASRIWNEFGLPTFLYEHSASAPHRVNLAAIRKGQFEGMSEKMQQPEWEPDFGNRNIHPTAGVTAVGARMPLIAFNINLSTSDVKIADNIAKIIRYSSGGFEGVKAIGILLRSRNIAQVSINMTRPDITPLYKVVEAVRIEAAKYGVSIIGTEIIGLTPMQALADCSEYYLKLENFDKNKQIIENHLW